MDDRPADTRAGEAVLAEASAAYQEAFGARLIACYALGSLAHGGFSPLVSDVDLGLMLSGPLRAADRLRVRAVARPGQPELLVAGAEFALGQLGGARRAAGPGADPALRALHRRSHRPAARGRAAPAGRPLRPVAGTPAGLSRRGFRTGRQSLTITAGVRQPGQEVHHAVRSDHGMAA